MIRTALVAVLLLAACTAPNGHTPSLPGPSPGHVTQQTTCGQWGAWTDDQRAQAAYDLAGPLGVKKPGRGFALRFAGWITRGCSLPSIRVAAVAASIAKLNHRDFAHRG